MKGVLAIIAFTMVLAGCGNSITGSNSDLNVAHVGGKDCAQGGCHSGIGAAGTVFTNLSSETPASGITVKAQSISTGALITLGTSDSMGNFHYHEELSGYYNMAVGSKSWSRPHSMPDWNGCNSCHTAPPAGGALGKLN